MLERTSQREIEPRQTEPSFIAKVLIVVLVAALVVAIWQLALVFILGLVFLLQIVIQVEYSHVLEDFGFVQRGLVLGCSFFICSV